MKVRLVTLATTSPRAQSAARARVVAVRVVERMKDPEGGSQLELQPLKGGSELERQAGPCPSYLRRTWDHRCGTIPPWARTALANLLLVFLWCDIQCFKTSEQSRASSAAAPRRPGCTTL